MRRNKRFQFWLFDGAEGGSPAGGTGDTGADNSGKPDDKATTTDSKPADTVSKAEYEALKAKYEKDSTELKTFREQKQKDEDAKKTVEQKAAELELQNKALARENLIIKTAGEMGLPSNLIKFVQGDTIEDIKAAIEELQSALKVEKKPGEGAVGGKGQPGSQTGELTHRQWRERKLGKTG